MTTQLNKIINGLKEMFEVDEDLLRFTDERYGKKPEVYIGDYNIADIPIIDMPIIIISDAPETEEEKKRFLFTENEARLMITIGLINNDMQGMSQDRIDFKEMIKGAIRKDPLINKTATYCTMISSKKVDTVSPPLAFMRLIIYVNYRSN